MKVVRFQNEPTYNYKFEDFCCNEFYALKREFYIDKSGVYLYIENHESYEGKYRIMYIKYCPFCGKAILLDY